MNSIPLNLWGPRTSSLKDQLSMEEWAFYEPKAERCRRVEGKEDQIKAERLAYKIQGQARYRMEEE